MVGGIVIEAAERDGRIFIDCRDRHNRDTCAIWVEKDENSVQVQIGDSIWWQGGHAMWTPAAVRDAKQENTRSGVDYDIKLRKVSNSGVELDRSA